MNLKQIAGLLTTVALILPASAQAHVSLHPNTIPAGAFVTLRLRVPGEQTGAHVTKLDTLLPPGFVSVDYANVPGWKVKLIEHKLATPVQSDDGPIDSEVAQIIWSWSGPEGRVENGQFIEFPLSVAIPAGDSGKSLSFKTVQTYSNGKVAHWIGTPSAEEPAPTVNITAKGGMIEDVAGGEAGPTPGETPQIGSSASPTTTSKASDRASKGLAIVALLLGALGLIAGGLALGSARRAPTGP